MNWLAHLRLAPPDPLLRLGNLCGDFVRGVDLAGLHPELRRGVLQHRAIDRFVDAHPAVRRSRSRLSPPFRRFAGVLVDVYFDHVLAAGWERFGDGGPLRGFVDGVHDDLERHRELLPPRLSRALPHLRTEDWLFGYRELDGIDAILRRMARRLQRPSVLGDGAGPLRELRAEFAADFVELWPELVAFAAGLAEPRT